MTWSHHAAIVGVGTIGVGRWQSASVADMANRAVAEAFDDCGLSRGEVDGLLVHIGSPRGLDYDAIARLLALDVRFASQTWSHGRFAATVLQHAAMGLGHGLARYVICLGAYKTSSFPTYGMPGYPGAAEAFREGGGPHAELPHAGMAAPVGGAAMATRRYLDTYGVDRELLATVAIAQRKHAALNPGARLTAPLDEKQYAESPYVVEPLRLLDCSVPVDTATAFVLTSVDRARDCPRPPVYLRGFQGLHAGPNEFIFGQPGMGVNQADTFSYRPAGAAEPVFEMAGIAPADIHSLHVYDGFAPQVLWTLERFGYCDPGSAAEWIQDGRIEPGGELPINTSGGHLSEGHTNGWGQMLEIARQLRREAGPRQIPGITLAQWATTAGDSIVFSSDLR